MAVAFVFSGGASLGASQAGMLEALFERRIRPDVLVGTSAGAINAAFIASRPPTVQTARELQQIWRELGRAHVFPTNPLTAGLGLLGLSDHCFSAGSLRRTICRHLELDQLEDAPTKLHVVAADLLTGEEVRLSAGPALDAILASAAIPGVFPAVPWESRLLMDGGIVNNTPISHAVALGARQVYALQAIGAGPLERSPRGVLGSAIAAVSCAITRRFNEDIARYASVVELMVLAAPPAPGVMPTDFGRADDLIEGGLRTARAQLALRRPKVSLNLRRAG